MATIDSKFVGQPRDKEFDLLANSGPRWEKDWDARNRFGSIWTRYLASPLTSKACEGIGFAASQDRLGNPKVPRGALFCPHSGL